MSKFELQSEKAKLIKFLENLESYATEIKATTLADLKYFIRVRIADIDKKLNHSDNDNFKPDYKIK